MCSQAQREKKLGVSKLVFFLSTVDHLMTHEYDQQIKVALFID